MTACNSLLKIISVILPLLFVQPIFANPALPVGVWTDIMKAGTLPSGTNFNQGMSIDPSNPDILYLCTANQKTDPTLGGIYKTTNGGDTWARIGHLTGAIHVRIDPNNSNHLYCADGVNGTFAFWVSNDGGNTWTIPAGFDSWAQTTGTYDCYDVAADPTDFNHVLVSFHSGWQGKAAGVAESKDGGNTWITHYPPTESWYAGMGIFFLYKPELGIGNSDTWLLTSQNVGFWRTENAGVAWTKVGDQDMTHGGNQIYYSSTGAIYAGSSLYLSRSTDNGQSWQRLSSSGLPYNYYEGVIGDGVHLYTAPAWQAGPYYTSLETDGLTWTPMTSAGSSFNGAFEMCLDKTNNILYASPNIEASKVIALKLKVDKPGIRLSGTPVSEAYTRGDPMLPRTRMVAAVNPYRTQGQHLSGAVSVSKKSSWLTVSVNAANVDSQVITNTIDPSGLPDAEAKYADTVKVHADGADAPDQSYVVELLIRNPATLTSITITPNAVIIAAGASRQFTASARDQYDLPLAPQPVFAWSATGGTVSANGLFTSGGCPGSFSVTASSSGKTGSSAITVAEPNASSTATATVSSTENGHTAQALIDGVAEGYPTNASKEWSANGEKAGAWAQLSWVAPVTIDSIALWDRPNADDQVLSGTLTFSDGSSIAVGELPNDASAPWAVKFASKSATWVKFTVNSVKSTTWNIGLAEFGVYSTLNCSTSEIHQPNLVHSGRETITVTAKGLFINTTNSAPWTLVLFSLNGSKIVKFSGKGTTYLPIDKMNTIPGFVTAKLQSGKDCSTQRLIVK